MLGSPLVTIVWACEQADFHILGSSTRTSDIRIILSFAINVGFVVAMYFLGGYKSKKEAIIMGVVLAFFSSHNIWFNLGVKKPFKIQNEKSMIQKEYGDIVFTSRKRNTVAVSKDKS